MRSDKKERQEAIAKALKESAISNQEDLLNMLTQQGFDLTQATLSRDFREMKIAKTPDEAGNYFYRLPSRLPAPKNDKHGMMASFSRQGVFNIEFSGQIAAIKTPDGYAKGISHDIDSASIPGIMATIGGDDTVIVLLRENADKVHIINDLKILFSTK